jgi:hypothetical protein
MRFCVSDFRARRAGPDHRPGSEVASVIATAQAHATTEDGDAADPQGRGSKNRGDQEQYFASANAENEATQGYPQQKRAADAENSEPCAVSAVAGHPPAGNPASYCEKARRGKILG